jgi:hypothetical protein
VSIQSNTSNRFETMDRNSQRLCWLLDMHGIKLNWPDGLPAFVHKLETDRHLAMDFWALVRSLRRTEPAGLGGQQISALVVSCVCGPNLVPSGHEDKVALNHLTSMLAASDASTDPNANLPDALLVSEKAKDPPMAMECSGAFKDEPEQSPIDKNEPVADNTLISRALSHHLDEALSRLELTSLELKVHLDNLDSRMSRIEPHLEDITSLVASKLTPSSPSGFKPNAISPETSSPDASTPLHSPEPYPAAMNYAVPGTSPQPEISWQDGASEWWTGTFAGLPAKGKTAWANKPQWKSLQPGLTVHLLPYLKQRWLDSRQFLSARRQNTHPRYVAIAFLLVVTTSAILGRALRHPSPSHATPPHEIKATEPPAGNAGENAIPPVVTSSDHLQPKVQPGTATAATPQPDSPKRKPEDDLIAKPTFKWLGDPDTFHPKEGDKTSTDRTPRAAVLDKRASGPAVTEVGIDTNPSATNPSAPSTTQ